MAIFARRSPSTLMFVLMLTALPSSQAQQPDRAVCSTPLASSLTIETAAQRLFACNADILQAQRAIEAAQADVMIAGQAPNPTLSLGVGSINPHLGIGNGGLRSKTVDSSIRVDQLLERGNKRELRTLATQKLVAAAQADLSETIRQKTLALTSLFYDTLAAQERSRLLTENMALYQRTADLSQKRLTAGDIAQADVSRLALDVLRANNDLSLAQSDQTRNKWQLAQLLGYSGSATAFTLDNGPISATPLPDNDQILIDRADLKALKSRAEAAATTRDLARSLQTRDISVGAQFDHYPTSPSNTQGQGNFFGVSVALPLFVRHQYEGEQQRAAADYYAAQDGYQLALVSARNELKGLIADVGMARERYVRYQNEIVPTAQQVADRAEVAYNKGASSVLDLLDARRALRQVQLDAVQARTDLAHAEWNLKLATQVTSAQP